MIWGYDNKQVGLLRAEIYCVSTINGRQLWFPIYPDIEQYVHAYTSPVVLPDPENMGIYTVGILLLSGMQPKA